MPKRLPLVPKTFEHLRERGYICESAERWVKIKGNWCRIDMWGFADGLCIRPWKPGMLAVQVCETSQLRDHQTKFRNNERTLSRLTAFLQVPDFRVELWGWEKERRLGRDIWVPTIIDAVIEKNSVKFRSRNESKELAF